VSITVDRKKMFVGGEFVEGTSGEWRGVLNPATGEVIAEVPECTEEDVDEAVRAARRAFAGWFETTLAERSQMLHRLADALEEHAEELALTESRNVGKPIASAREELPYIVDNLRFFAGAGRLIEGKSAGEYSRGYTSMIRREPVGVVGQIAPWNYPLMMAVWKIAPALAAGNTVVLKPSEQTPLTILKMAGLAADIFPGGVLNVITGDGEPVGAGIVRHAGVDMVSLTGDIATGKAVARAAAETLKRVHLELGGKAPVVIFDDADLEAVVESSPQATLRDSLDQRPHHHGLRNAARQLSGVGLRQGHECLRDRRLHSHQARYGEVRLNSRVRYVPRGLRSQQRVVAASCEVRAACAPRREMRVPPAPAPSTRDPRSKRS
jgi:acyl-CoA reductase-like NAD-dependent aldehyde dehydrogenase